MDEKNPVIDDVSHLLVFVLPNSIPRASINIADTITTRNDKPYAININHHGNVIICLFFLNLGASFIWLYEVCLSGNGDINVFRIFSSSLFESIGSGLTM
jgi:hypothetical protein